MRPSLVIIARALYLLAISHAGLAARWEVAVMHLVIFTGSLVIPWLAVRKDDRYFGLDVYAVAVFAVSVLITDWSGGVDKVFHVLGGAGAAWFAMIWWHDRTEAGRLEHAILASVVIGVAWECYEYVLWLLPDPLSVEYSGIQDSLFDTLADVIGGFLAVVVRRSFK